MKQSVLGSHALLAYSEGEAGSERLIDIFTEAFDNNEEVFVCVVIWREMYHIVLREGGEDKGDIRHMSFMTPNWLAKRHSLIH